MYLISAYGKVASMAPFLCIAPDLKGFWASVQIMVDAGRTVGLKVNRYPLF